MTASKNPQTNKTYNSNKTSFFRKNEERIT